LSDFDFKKVCEYLIIDINDGIEGSVFRLFKQYSKKYNPEHLGVDIHVSSDVDICYIIVEDIIML